MLKTATVPQLQYSDEVVDVLAVQVVVLPADGGSASDSVHRWSWWTFSFATEMGTFQHMVPVKGFFRVFSAFFRAPPDCPGVERQFFEPPTMKSSSSSIAPRGGGVAGSLTPR